MNAQEHIRNSIQGAIDYYLQHPDETVWQDKEAIAVIEEGLRVRASGPDGQTLICDMPKMMGGEGASPSPGWMVRAALANCEAVMIALRAAQLSVELTKLEVRVDSLSDDRGLLGMDDTVPAGPLSMKISVRIGAEGVSEEMLHEIVDWAEKHSPVGEPLTRVVPVDYIVDIV